MKTHKTNRLARWICSLGALAVFATMVMFIALGSVSTGLNTANAEIVGNPDGATTRALIADGAKVTRITYFKAGAKTMANTTPVASDAKCGNFGTQHRADVVWVATMTGTNPTLTILWQNSIDGGVTWQDVGTWVAYNATSNPATQTNKVSDIPGGVVIPFTTPATMVPQIYGDCWRSTYAFGGTGTVTASFKIVGVEK